MAMHSTGLTKLMEECGELIQIAAKKAAHLDKEVHPDGQNMQARLEEEMADVLAACKFVAEQFALDEERIRLRAATKYDLFQMWHNK